ncbi:MAG TPA: hypothetical protein VLF63_03665 [Patescibacteria group bacterium]|nr:hypothetical protein [Patescibacteria group bacterium]
MTIWWLVVILSFIGSAGLGFVWLIVKMSQLSGGKGKSISDSFQDAADQDVEHIFNEEFREELRNRGRLHFEKIISENAMFLQQDLRLTTSELNEYMKTEVSKSLKEEFSKYEQSINDAKQLAIDSIQKTNQAIDEQRKELSKQVEKQVNDTKQLLIERFERNMTEIINHYIVAAIGNQIDLSDQLEYIIGELESNKNAIVEDVINGA